MMNSISVANIVSVSREIIRIGISVPIIGKQSFVGLQLLR